MTDKDNTPALPEPVAYKYRDGSNNNPKYDDHLPVFDSERLYSEDQMQALADRLAECDRQSEIMLNSYADENQRLHDRATTAEAALEGARKVIEAADRLNEQANHVGIGGCIASMTIHDAAKELLPLVTLYEAAHAEWLSANPEVNR